MKNIFKNFKIDDWKNHFFDNNDCKVKEKIIQKFII